MKQLTRAAGLSSFVTLIFLASVAQAVDKPGSGAGVTVELTGQETPEAIKRTIEGLAKSGQRVTLRIGTTPEGPSAIRASGRTEDLDGPSALWTKFVDGFAHGNDSIAAIPRLLPDWRQAWAGVTNAASTSEALTRAGGVVLTALAGAILLRALADRLWPPVPFSMPAPFLARLRVSSIRLLKDVAALAVFLAIARTLEPLLLPAVDIIRATVSVTTQNMAVAALYLCAARFFLSPENGTSRLVPIAHSAWHTRMLTLYGVLASVLYMTVGMATRIATDPASVVGWFAIAAAIITLFKLWWFWVGRRDIQQLVLDAAENPQAPSAPRRIAAIMLPLLLMASAIVIWIVGRISSVVSGGERWAGAAGMTQFLIVLVPILATGAQSAMAEILARRDLGSSRTAVATAAVNVAERGAGWFVWIAGLYALAEIWGVLASDVEPTATIAALKTLVAAATIVFAGFVIWTFLRALLNAHAPQRLPAMPGEEENAEATVQSRLATVMPVLRGFLLGAVIGLTALIALAKLGIDTGPLLAGFGILGLAISFGSQALVRDIVSGIFFMTDDAFRVGEYIDTGKLKGTVEKITLRSVQLRHQSGLVHTIPFGQIASVTNASRDWATVKFNVRLDRTVDVDKARKAIKKVGLEMLDEPEIAAELILPLKMQGIADIVDNAIVCRLKFTSKPARSGWVQREALKRVYRALSDAGIQFANNAVMVRSNGEAPLPSQVAAVAGQISNDAALRLSTNP